MQGSDGGGPGKPGLPPFFMENASATKVMLLRGWPERAILSLDSPDRFDEHGDAGSVTGMGVEEREAGHADEAA